MIGPAEVAPWLPLSWLGVAILAGSLAGAWWAGRALPRFGIPASYVWSLYPAAILAGGVGAKLWAATETLFNATGELTFAQVLHSRDGATFYGGLALGALAVSLKTVFDGKSLFVVSTAIAPTLALSQAVGRLGCFLVGCDYGVPTSLPWGMTFPNAVQPSLVAVHPTQLYEALWLFGSALFLRSRIGVSRLLIAEYLVLQGAGRFAIEFIRTNPKTLGVLTTSQAIAFCCLAAGIVGLATVSEFEERR